MFSLIIKYDASADVLSVKIQAGALSEEELLDNDLILGYDATGKVVSIEVLDASKKGLLNAFIELAKNKKDVAKLLLSKVD
jgi:uncharacterized protein YuzE